MGGGAKYKKNIRARQNWMKKILARQLILKQCSCYGLKKIHTRNLITKKNSCGSKIPLPHPPITFLMVRPLYIQRIRVFLGPFFFTTLFRLNIVINQFCDFFTRIKRMNVHQEVLNVLFALLRRWWKRSYFSFKLQTHPPVFMSRNHAPSQ